MNIADDGTPFSAALTEATETRARAQLCSTGEHARNSADDALNDRATRGSAALVTDESAGPAVFLRGAVLDRLAGADDRLRK